MRSKLSAVVMIITILLAIAFCLWVGLSIAQWIWNMDIPEWLKVYLIAS